MKVLGIFLLLASAASAAKRSQEYYDGLVQFALGRDDNDNDNRRRDLQSTPAEEEGHPQQVDALYQGYGKRWRGTAASIL